MFDPAPDGPGLPAPASLGANAESLSAVRLATSGTVAAGSDAGLSLHGWDGEEVSPGAGMVFLRARWLLAAEGVFASADLFLGAAGLPSTLNRYAFGLGDPVNRFDPTGRWPWVRDVASTVRSAVDAYVPQPPGIISQVISHVNYVAAEASSAMGAARAAGGTEWVVMQAGRVAAAIAARFCGSAAYMSKSAPKPSGTRQVTTALSVLGSAIGLDASLVNAALDMSRALSSSGSSLAAGCGLTLGEVPRGVNGLLSGMTGIGIVAGLFNTGTNVVVALGDEGVPFERQISNAAVELGLGLGMTAISASGPAIGTGVGALIGGEVGAAVGAAAGFVISASPLIIEYQLRRNGFVDEWKRQAYKGLRGRG